MAPRSNNGRHQSLGLRNVKRNRHTVSASTGTDVRLARGRESLVVSAGSTEIIGSPERLNQAATWSPDWAHRAGESTPRPSLSNDAMSNGWAETRCVGWTVHKKGGFGENPRRGLDEIIVHRYY
ncbi:hypothetical protein N7510_005105 [Penicillium lagena]|uniref:uncharacterized protein n=1 Tax=Penicillium lagena TaxID=94218 RepID=UPI0025412F67|nr:uncharacterized protein N7510_005105 [Penicillium lagena]KAJ5621121.1 hypothetical protein N7510_005105 [Penicillium lagena]